MGPKARSLSHRLCPPGPPGRRSRAAQALKAQGPSAEGPGSLRLRCASRGNQFPRVPPPPSGGARWETNPPVPQVVPARATGPQVQGRAGPGRSRRSETPQDGYNDGRACVFGTGPAVLLQAVRPRFYAAAFGWGWGLLRVGSLLAGKHKPRPGLGVAAFSPKQPAARRRRWRRAHFGTTGLRALPSPQRNGATEQQTKHPRSPRRESDPPEAPCQANRKEGAGHNAPPARPLGAIPPQGQPPNQASSNHTLRLRLSPM